MEIIEGKVSNYKGHGDIHRFYGKIGEEIKYYFLDFSPLSNGNMIATTELVEAIDSEVPASHIGLVDNEGNVIIPLENKTIKPITGDILLVERLNPLSQNVLDAIAASKDTKLATGLVSITNTCKNKVMEKLGVSSELVFHNQLSEASIFDINGNNLVNNEYYSYIGVNADKVYLGKNLVDAPISEYSMLPPEIQSNTMVPDNAVVDNNINVEKAAVNADEIKDAVEGVMAAQEESVPETPVEETAPVDPVVPETPVEEAAPADPVVPETPVEEAAPADPVVPETPIEEAAPADPVVPETPVEETAPADPVVPETPVEEVAPVDPVVPETPAEGGAEMFGLPPVEVPVVAEPTQDIPVVNPSEVQETVGGENTEEPVQTTENINAGFNNIDIPDVPIVEEPVPVDIPVVGDNIVDSVVDAAQEVVEEAPAPVVETENIINDDNVDNVDDVLNSLFGSIANVEEPASEPTEDVPVEENNEKVVEEVEKTDEVTSEEVAGEVEEVQPEESVVEETPTDVVDEATEETESVNEVSAEEVAGEVEEAQPEESVVEETPTDVVDEAAEETESSVESMEKDTVEAGKEQPEENDVEEVATVEDDQPEDTSKEDEVELPPVVVGNEPIEEEEEIEEDNSFSNLINDNMVSSEEVEKAVSRKEEVEEAQVEEEKDDIIEDLDEDDDMFSDINVDKIVTENEYDFNDSYDKYNDFDNNEPEYNDYSTLDRYDNRKDDLLSNAGKVMSSLITLNRKQKSDISRLNNEINKVNNSNRAKSEKIDLLESKLNTASNKVRNLDTIVNKLESKNTMLSSKVDDQKRLIESQSRELSSKDREIEELRRQLQGKDELAKFIADAQNLLGQNDY